MVYTMYMSWIYHTYTIYSCTQHLKHKYALKKILAYTLPSRHPRHGFPAIEYEKLKQMNNSIYKVYVWYIPYIYRNM